MSSMSGMFEFKRGRLVNCYCGSRTKGFTSSSTNANLGRRFDVCRKKNDRCRFWEWFDEKNTSWKQKLITALLKRIRKMENKIVGFRAREKKLWFGCFLEAASCCDD